MFEMLIKLIFWLITQMSNLILTPIINFLTNVFPTLDTLISNVQWFLSTYVFPTLQWTKMFLINCLSFPKPLFEFLTGVFIIMVSIHAVLTIYEGALRIYNHFKP